MISTYVYRIIFSFGLDDTSESDLLTVHNVNEWLSSLRLVPTSATSVDVDIFDEGFKQFDRYKVEFTTIDQLDQWQQVDFHRQLYFSFNNQHIFLFRFLI